MRTSKEILSYQLNKLHFLWKNDGHFGMYEDDPDNNNDTRELIKAYAEENDGKVFLLSDASKKMEYTNYAPNEKIYNLAYKYITNSKETAKAICAAHNVPYAELLKNLKRLEKEHADKYIYLIWN